MMDFKRFTKTEKQCDDVANRFASANLMSPVYDRLTKGGIFATDYHFMGHQKNDDDDGKRPYNMAEPFADRN